MGGVFSYVVAGWKGRRLTAMMGSDIHENTFKEGLSDGEPGDS